LFAEQLQVAATIAVIEEAMQAVVTALDHLLRDTWQVEAWLSGHCRSIRSNTTRR